MKRTSILSTSVAAALLIAGSAYAGELTIFTQPNFRGADMTISGATNDLDRTGFNDRAASAIVRSGRWEVCSDANFSGQCVVLGPGDYPMLRDPLFRRVSSAREIGPYAVIERPYRYSYVEPTYVAPTYVAPTYVAPVEERGRYSALEVYTLPGFRGSTMKFDRSATSLDRRATDEGLGSLVVREGVWEVCTGLEYNGTCRIYQPGRYARLGNMEGAPVGSLRRVG